MFTYQRKGWTLDGALDTEPLRNSLGEGGFPCPEVSVQHQHIAGADTEGDEGLGLDVLRRALRAPARQIFDNLTLEGAAVPMVVVILPITHFVLTRVAFPLRLKSLPGGREYIDSELARLGTMSKAEKLVAFVFGLTATLWVIQPLISGFIPGLSDTTIAIFCALLLFLIIFVWTPPHFWALAIARRDDYAKVGIPMLPVTHGIAFTRQFILLYTILLVLTTILPYLSGMSGLIYLVSAVALGGVFLWYAVRLKYDHAPALPMRVFRYSINYLMLLFAAILLDHYFIFTLHLNP